MEKELKKYINSLETEIHLLFLKMQSQNLLLKSTNDRLQSALEENSQMEKIILEIESRLRFLEHYFDKNP